MRAEILSLGLHDEELLVELVGRVGQPVASPVPLKRYGVFVFLQRVSRFCLFNGTFATRWLSIALEDES
jgi:hypothetical protein